MIDGAYSVTYAVDMPRTSLNLPVQLKEDAEEWAVRQGVSLNQFIAWAVAEKIGGLRQRVDDPRFPHVTFVRGAAGWPMAVIRGTAIRVQTLATAVEVWRMSPSEVAAEYDLSADQVMQALAFAHAHREEIDASRSFEERRERAAS